MPATPDELPEPLEARSISISASSSICELVRHVKAATCCVLPKLSKWRGDFIRPWDWRQGVRLSANDNQPGECLIKGNIGRRGTRIYHVPGGQYYARTRIDPSKGEKWFCSETEARAAGWRRSSR